MRAERKENQKRQIHDVGKDVTFMEINKNNIIIPVIVRESAEYFDAQFNRILRYYSEVSVSDNVLTITVPEVGYGYVLDKQNEWIRVHRPFFNYTVHESCIDILLLSINKETKELDECSLFYAVAPNRTSPITPEEYITTCKGKKLKLELKYAHIIEDDFINELGKKWLDDFKSYAKELPEIFGGEFS